MGWMNPHTKEDRASGKLPKGSSAEARAGNGARIAEAARKNAKDPKKK